MSFSRTTEKYLIEVPDEDHMGPAMKRLNDRQRRFVCAMSVYGGDVTRAYVFAGYDIKTPGALKACASRLHNNAQIIDALQEEARRRLDYSHLVTVSGLVELALPSNTDKSSRLKALLALADRTGMHAKSEQLVVHEDRRTTKELLDAIAQIAVRNGLDPAQLLGHKRPDVIDAEYEEVPAGTDGIEDLF
jgi:hypothetical protein